MIYQLGNFHLEKKKITASYFFLHIPDYHFVSEQNRVCTKWIQSPEDKLFIIAGALIQ